MPGPRGPHLLPLVASTFTDVAQKIFVLTCSKLVWSTFRLSFVIGQFWHFDVTSASLLELVGVKQYPNLLDRAVMSFLLLRLTSQWNNPAGRGWLMGFVTPPFLAKSLRKFNSKLRAFKCVLDLTCK